MEKLGYELNPSLDGNEFKANRGGSCFFVYFFTRSTKSDKDPEYSSFITQSPRPILKANK